AWEQAEEPEPCADAREGRDGHAVRPEAVEEATAGQAQHDRGGGVGGEERRGPGKAEIPREGGDEEERGVDAHAEHDRGEQPPGERAVGEGPPSAGCAACGRGGRRYGHGQGQREREEGETGSREEEGAEPGTG